MSWGWTGYGNALCRRYLPRSVSQLRLQVGVQFGKAQPQRSAHAAHSVARRMRLTDDDTAPRRVEPREHWNGVLSNYFS